MDTWERQRQFHRQERHPHRRDHHPSFSSTLLDTIYRSIDEGEGARTRYREEELVLYTQSMRKIVEEDDKVPVRRKSTADFDRRSRHTHHSSSGSSDSSSTSAFYYASQRPKPTRDSYGYGYSHDQKPKQGFVKAKSRALKNIYGDLKKVKQPISPGGRLASFLNSIFTNAKKAKTESSTCSSASSFSRSCLSKTPTSSSSRAQADRSVKRSVRFVDEDCRPCRHKNLHDEAPKTRQGSEEKLRVQEAARDLLKTYRQIQNETLSFLDQVDGEDKDDDDASCASSDLFELDNLSTIEELPVYETTHLGTNRAIAKGLIV